MSNIAVQDQNLFSFHADGLLGFRKPLNYTADILPIVEDIKNYFNVSGSLCTSEGFPRITIVHRKSSRKIENEEDIILALQKG